LSPKQRKYHKTDRKSLKPIIPNTSKTASRTSSVYSFMRLIHRRNNSNKETFIYTPYAPMLS